MKELHTAYRPQTLERVVGHKDVVSSLNKVLEEGSSRAFIFTGPAGIGKTTFARIIARRLGASPANIIEIDAATSTGVDAMRDRTSTMNYAALGESKTRVYIIDEAHRLSSAAWDSMLKAIEEPPPHIGWVLCTSVKGKIPATIASRCVQYDLKPLSRSDVRLAMKRTAKKAGLAIKPSILDYLSEKSGGSIRRALTWMAQAQGMKTRKEASELIQQQDEGDEEIISLCRELVGRPSWPRALALCKKMQDTNPESIRIVICAYFTKVLFGTTNEKRAEYLLDVLSSFSDPYPPGATIGSVLISLGNLLLD